MVGKGRKGQAIINEARALISGECKGMTSKCLA